MLPSASVLLSRLLARGKFRHVQVLLKLVELGSVQRTAQSIGITQSSVTQTLAYLERLLEMQLFQRHARGVRPTPACLDLLPVARQLMLGLAEGAEVIAARRSRGHGIVRLMASAAATNGLLVQVLPRFTDRASAVQVHLTEAEGDDQLLGIARGEVDIVACRRPAVVPEGWAFHRLRDDRFAVVCSARHRLARRRRVSWAELEPEVWLLAPAGSAARERFDELAQCFSQAPRTYPVVTRVLTMTWWLLRDHQLLAFLPDSFVRHLIEAGELAEVRVGDSILMNPLGVLVPCANLGDAAARLFAFLQEACSTDRPRARQRSKPRPGADRARAA